MANDHIDPVDPSRWDRFEQRPGDIVIVAPPGSGASTLQQLLTAMILDTADPDLPFREISPWIDLTRVPESALFAHLGAQSHRRVIRTTSPLSRVDPEDGVYCIVVGRHPLDIMASSRSAANRDRLHHFITATATATGPTLHSVVGLISEGWELRRRGRVGMTHYLDLGRDPVAELNLLTDLVELGTVPGRIREVVHALAHRQATPPRLEALADPPALFRTGRSGRWRRWADEELRLLYHRQLRQLAGENLVRWLHDGTRTALLVP